MKEAFDAVVRGDVAGAREAVGAALQAGAPATRILNEALITAMAEVGRLFETGEYFLPEMLIAARAMQAGLGLLKPHLAQSDAPVVGRVAIGTVKGDLHDIGKNLVVMMLEGAGLEVVDLGANVPPERFVEAARGGVQVVAMSALITTTMPQMRETIQALRDAGVRDGVRVVVGGAPLSESFAGRIGADGYAPDASSAVRVVKALLAQ